MCSFFLQMSLKCLSNHGNLFKVQHSIFYAAWLVHILFCITKPRWRHALTLTLPKHLHTQTNSADAPHHTHDTCVTCLSYMSHVTVTVWQSLYAYVQSCVRVRWESGGVGGRGCSPLCDLDECDCAGAFMLPHFDSAGLAPSRRSAGV